MMLPRPTPPRGAPTPAVLRQEAGACRPSASGPGAPRSRCRPSRLAAGPGLVAALAFGLALAGCAPPRSRSDQAAVAACRAEADRVDAQQNRYELSERSTRDSPLSSSGTIGITSAGLGQLYGRDVDIESCLRDRRAADTSTQPAASTGMSPQMDPSASMSQP